ncbi:hypothetical protein [Streptomyces sp. NPDC005423]|uniref:BACON domain-containing protein n=1 Tax=Streptomyces sp. NPDC005423 TaxID=3155343 RepID=UPI0033BC5EB0
MMSSSPETPARTTGAHRAYREARDLAAARTLAQRTPARYEPYLDGLFTYCLSVLCDHDTATAALGEVLALAERRGARGPESSGQYRAWLYALARWECLRRLTETEQKRQGTHAAGRGGRAGREGRAGRAGAASATRLGRVRESGARDGAECSAEPAVREEALERRRRELALLAWPEAAGTAPEQREALELAVRHGLAAPEVAAVLGMDLAATRDLLASAACEVERTRAALAVVETGTCPSVARLVGDHQFVLGTALRRELVRHVDDCPLCRRTAERAVPGRWPGASVTPAELPVLEAPRATLHATLAHLPRARGAAPRFDRRGFPMDPKDSAARRDRLRARAVTTTVVATVVAAPVLALWAAYRSTPTGEGVDARTATASEAHGTGSTAGPDGPNGAPAGGHRNAGDAGTSPGTGDGKGGRPDVSVEVVSVTGAGRKGPGHLALSAANSGDTTVVSLTASGSAPVSWSATTTAPWLYLSRSSGTLAPGDSFTIKVYVDPLREPVGHWTARVALAPAGAVVSIQGYGTATDPTGSAAPSAPPRPPDPAPPDQGGHPGPGHPHPSGPGPTPSAPTEPPTSPAPTPTAPPPTATPTSAPPPGAGTSSWSP